MSVILLPYAVHAFTLSLVHFSVAHVEIALCALPASAPWAAWAGATLIIKGAQARPDFVGNTKETSTTRTGERSNDTGEIYRSREQLSVEDNVKRKSLWWRLHSHLWMRWSIIWLLISSVLWLAHLPPAWFFELTIFLITGRLCYKTCVCMRG